MKVIVKRRRPKPTAWWKRVLRFLLRFLADLVSASIAAVIAEATVKWLFK